MTVMKTRDGRDECLDIGGVGGSNDFMIDTFGTGVIYDVSSIFIKGRKWTRATYIWEIC